MTWCAGTTKKKLQWRFGQFSNVSSFSGVLVPLLLGSVFFLGLPITFVVTMETDPVFPALDFHCNQKN